MVHAEFTKSVEAIVARPGGDDGSAGPFGELVRRQAHAPGPGLDQHGLPRLEAAELEQAVIWGAKGDRHARGGHHVGPVGDYPGGDSADGHSLGVRARGRDRHDACPDSRLMTPAPTSRIVPAHW